VKKYLRIFGCLGLAAFIAWRLDWGHLGAAFARLDLTLWLLAVGVYVGAQVISSVRWRLLARAIGFGGSTVRYVSYYFAGMFWSLALPTSVGGDVMRGLYLANQGGPAAPRRLEAFLSVFAERLSGVLMLAALACVATPFCPFPLPDRVLAGVALVGTGAVVGSGLLLVIPGDMTGGRSVRARLSGVVGLYRSRPRLLLGSALLSFLVQALNVVLVALVGAALGLPVPLLYYAVIVPLVSLLTLLPVSINGMGLREGAYILFLAPLQIDQAVAVGLGLLTFAATALPALGGAFVLLSGRLPRFGARPGGESVEVRTDDEPHRGDPDQGRARQPRAAA
jgi:uncharacterized membrane protein YbhN (UPF0104 family)